MELFWADWMEKWRRSVEILFWLITSSCETETETAVLRPQEWKILQRPSIGGNRSISRSTQSNAVEGNQRHRTQCDWMEPAPFWDTDDRKRGSHGWIAEIEWKTSSKPLDADQTAHSGAPLRRRVPCGREIDCLVRFFCRDFWPWSDSVPEAIWWPPLRRRNGQLDGRRR